METEEEDSTNSWGPRRETPNRYAMLRTAVDSDADHLQYKAWPLEELPRPKLAPPFEFGSKGGADDEDDDTRAGEESSVSHSLNNVGFDRPEAAWVSVPDEEEHVDLGGGIERDGVIYDRNSCYKYSDWCLDQTENLQSSSKQHELDVVEDAGVSQSCDPLLLQSPLADRTQLGLMVDEHDQVLKPHEPFQLTPSAKAEPKLDTVKRVQQEIPTYEGANHGVEALDVSAVSFQDGGKEEMDKGLIQGDNMAISEWEMGENGGEDEREDGGLVQAEFAVSSPKALPYKCFSGSSDDGFYSMLMGQMMNSKADATAVVSRETEQLVSMVAANSEEQSVVVQGDESAGRTHVEPEMGEAEVVLIGAETTTMLEEVSAGDELKDNNGDNMWVTGVANETEAADWMEMSGTVEERVAEEHKDDCAEAADWAPSACIAEQTKSRECIQESEARERPEDDEVAPEWIGKPSMFEEVEAHERTIDAVGHAIVAEEKSKEDENTEKMEQVGLVDVVSKGAEWMKMLNDPEKVNSVERDRGDAHQFGEELSHDIDEVEAEMKADNVDTETIEETDGEEDTEEMFGAEEAEEINGAEEIDDAEEVEETRTKSVKKKRGKKAKAPSKVSMRKTVEEDVCFICFDGGDLVLCDHRGCPKAYHPTCVNRDEAFFRAKGRWNCGWHLCSSCQKNAYYKCYTCTFSLCKGCIKDAVILCVRGNIGFCEVCLKTIMLIEGVTEHGSQEMVHVDFDDKSSWEYLFKDYWLELKRKFSLTRDDVANAKNPRRGSDSQAAMQESPGFNYARDGGSGSEGSERADMGAYSKRRKARKRLKSVPTRDSPHAGAVGGAGPGPKGGGAEWASRDLLEFVVHMKQGDGSPCSQFDVQALLLVYIKQNRLRDPRRKSQIVCDPRLEKLFGKPRVGHFEMLKLLESHFLLKDDSLADDVQGSVVDTEASQLEADGNSDAHASSTRDRRRRLGKRDEGKPAKRNTNDYAAIDMHNIGLIYLRRNLMEELLKDEEAFSDKVVGSFVRIRISGSALKQDLYRLVQVVGTNRDAKPYKVGKRSTTFLLEILNLSKTDIISIDTVSNQDFTEDECKRLRQSIKCGLISTLTVGDIQEKAIALLAVRVEDSLETEITKLNHLRDRASDMGRRKDLRECVEKLQLIKTPEERQRRLEEIPVIHEDPNMDPNYESEDDEDETVGGGRQDHYPWRGGDHRFGRNYRDASHHHKGGGYGPNDGWSGTRNYPSVNHHDWRRTMTGKGLSHRNDDAVGAGEILHENVGSWSQPREQKTATQNHGWDKSKTSPASSSDTRTTRSAVVSESGRKLGFDTSPESASVSASPAVVPDVKESEKTWHYQDPTGKIQGPFSMVQLRKWSGTGYFPSDLRIWRTSEKQDESILLNDALIGNFRKAPTTTLPETGLQSPAAAPSSTSRTKSRLFRSRWSPTPAQPIADGSDAGGNSSSGTNPSLPPHHPGPRTVSDGGQFAQVPSPSPLQGNSFPAHPSISSGVLPGAPFQNPSPNNSLSVPAQPAANPNWTGPPPSLGNLSAANLSAVSLIPAATGLMTAAPSGSVSWGTCATPSANLLPQTQVTENQGWGFVQANTTTAGWCGPAPANPNQCWVAPIPSQPPNACWAAPVQGQATANVNVGWVAPGQPQSAIVPNSGWMAPPPVHGQTMANTNPTWNVFPGWVPPVQAPAWNAAGPAAGNLNPGWVNPPGNPSMREPERNNGDGQPSQNTMAGFLADRTSLPSSRPPSKGPKVCKYYEGGHCKKGTSCDYFHP